LNARVLVVPSLALLLAGCGGIARERDASAASVSAPVQVSVVQATAQQWPSVYEATGTVRARFSTVISSKWMGYVREVKVQPGDRVREGQSLVILDARDLDAAAGSARAGREEVRNAIPEADSAVAAAKAHLDLVEVTYKRMKQLYEKTSISDQEFDEASAKLKAAQAELAMAQARRAQLDQKLAQAEQEVRAAEVSRSYAEVNAPVGGIVTAKSVDPGNLAAPGTALMTIESGGYRLEASVEESKISSIRTGQAVSAAIDGIERVFGARVSEIVPAVDPASRAYTVKIDLPAIPRLQSGTFGRARFQLGSRQVLAIPAAAVTERGQLQSVFVADNGVARTRLVTVGEKTKDQVEVLSGLSAGDSVIFPITAGIGDGSRVEVRP